MTKFPAWRAVSTSKVGSFNSCSTDKPNYWLTRNLWASLYAVISDANVTTFIYGRVIYIRIIPIRCLGFPLFDQRPHPPMGLMLQRIRAVNILEFPFTSQVRLKTHLAIFTRPVCRSELYTYFLSCIQLARHWRRQTNGSTARKKPLWVSFDDTFTS